jgi:hypothetical protein
LLCPFEYLCHRSHPAAGPSTVEGSKGRLSDSMTQTQGRPSQQKPGSPRSERIIRLVIVAGLMAGFLALGALGVYAYLEYLRIPEPLDLSGGTATVLARAPRGTQTFVTEAALPVTRSPTAEITSSPSPTPDLAATATAACAEFMSQFPGTPCPGMDGGDIAATATAACQQFQQQFPGTPCP